MKESFEDDLLLFVHLIPLCQFQQSYNSNTKSKFEDVMNNRANEYGDRNNFIDFLLSHPSNNSVKFYTSELKERYLNIIEKIFIYKN